MAGAVITAASFVDGTDSLDLMGDDGVCLVSVQFGLPTVRAVLEQRVGGSGARDTTSLHGERAVTLTFESVATATEEAPEVQDVLAAFLRPARRFYLHLTWDGTPPRRLLLRAASGDLSVTADRQFGLLDSSYQFVAPDGVFELATAESETVSATPDIEAGRLYPLTFDRSYPASSPVGVVTVTNSGTADVWPVVSLYGPCEDPQVENQTTGKKMLFSGLTLLDGEFLELDMRERTAYLDGNSSQSRLSFLDFSESEWWPLVPGDNDIRFFPVTDNGGAQAIVDFRSAFL